MGQITLDTLDKNRLIIDAEPHVMSRIRSLFNGILTYSLRGQYTHRPISVAFNQSHSRDILWISDRYPLAIPMDIYTQIKTKANEYDRILKEVSRADQNKTWAPSPSAYKLALPLRDHQIQFANMAKKVKRMLLADKMGLGKTASAIALLVEPESRPAIVVVPPHLCTQWDIEIKRFLPQAKTHIIRGFKTYQISKEVDIIITSYNRLAPWQDRLELMKFNTVIFDEVHELRHKNTEKRIQCKKLSETADMVIGLSGTPIYNRGAEMWSVMDVIAPNSLGNEEDFKREWCDMDSVREPAVLHTYLKNMGLMLRRVPKDVGLNFGKASKHFYTLDADLEKLKEVQEVAKMLAISVLSGNISDSNTSARDFDIKLRQATGIAKAKPVAEFVKMLCEQGEKVVLAGWHRHCFARGTKIIKFDGSIENVENIKVGDLLLGPDSKKRIVKNTTKGFGNMFKIIPKKGESWYCSENHILTLHKNGKNNKIINMTALEFFLKSKRQQRNYTLMRSEKIIFENTKKVFEPWLMGYWLGDGASSLNDFRISSNDIEVENKLKQISKKYNLKIKKWKSLGHSGSSTCHQYMLSSSHQKSPRENEILKTFKKYNLKNNKHIPQDFKLSNIKQRRELLAGLIDSDGHVYKNGCGAQFSNSNYQLIKDVLWICRSIGLAAYSKKIRRSTSFNSKKKNYYVVNISGDLTQIPLVVKRKKERSKMKRKINKSVLRVGFNIEKCKKDNFFGFEIDSDHLFLLEDFTIVHNCYDIWLNELKDYKPVMYTGTESVKEKDEAKKQFIEGDAQVFIISLRSGAGLDGLQRVCNSVVFGELDWSPHVMDQVIARLDRDGQTEHVQAFYMTVNDGSDPFIVQMNSEKRSQHDGLVEGVEVPVEILDDHGGGATNERIHNMAKKYLQALGEEIPEAVPEVGLLGDLAKALRKLKITANTEADMQLAIEQNLPKLLPQGDKIEREFYFTKRSRIDFLVTRGEERIGLECKNTPAKRADVYRQLRKYVEDGGITALVLFAPWHGVSAFKVDGIPCIVVDTSIASV